MDEGKDKLTIEPWTLKFMLWPDPQKPCQRCKPMEILKYLKDSKQLSHFILAISEERKTREMGGDCHNVTLALMGDLIIADRVRGWNWLEGYEKVPMENGTIADQNVMDGT
ncbi:MAG: hypothetical protein L7F78_16175 [Syntrophales bacterium LBB04]|nr:hypothetical protein [Syntrophales bacterium LBB04]